MEDGDGIAGYIVSGADRDKDSIPYAMLGDDTLLLQSNSLVCLPV